MLVVGWVGVVVRVVAVVLGIGVVVAVVRWVGVVVVVVVVVVLQ